MREKSYSPLVFLRLKPNQLLRRLLKASPEADVHIPPAGKGGILPTSQLKKPFSGLLRKSIQTPPETAQCSTHNYQPLNLTALFRANSESLIPFETAPAATFLHRRPLPCRSSYQSCTGDHLPAPVDNSRHQFCTSDYQS